MAPQQIMATLPEGHDTVKTKPCRATPDGDVTVRYRYPLRLVSPIQSTKEKDCRQAERHRNDGGGKIALVPVLMQ